MIPQITQIWDYIGSAWSNFQDKELTEYFWASLASGMQYTHAHVSNVQFSRTIKYMYPTFDYGPEVFYMVYSGATEVLTVIPLDPSNEQIENGGFETNTSGWISQGSVAFSRSNSYAHTGTWSLLLPTNTTSCVAKYTFGGNQLPSSMIEAWFYLSATREAERMKAGPIGLLALDENGLIISVALANTMTSGWQKLSIYNQAGNIRGVAVYNMAAYNVYVDDVSVKRSDLFEYPLPEYTYSMPTLAYKYKYNGITYSGLYTEGTDYLISAELNSLIWLNRSIHKDLRFSDKSVLYGIADHVYRINPVLGDVWARQCGFKIASMFPYYGTFGQEKYKHLKMLIWGLDYYQTQAPSTHTLKHAYGMTRGLPFAYESGIMSYTYSSGLYRASIGGDTFIFPSGIRPLSTGYYDKFEILASGLELYDYVSGPTVLSLYTNPYNRRSTLIYDVDNSLSGLSFSREFLDTYMANIIPEQIQYLTI